MGDYSWVIVIVFVFRESWLSVAPYTDLLVGMLKRECLLMLKAGRGGGQEELGRKR